MVESFLTDLAFCGFASAAIWFSIFKLIESKMVVDHV